MQHLIYRTGLIASLCGFSFAAYAQSLELPSFGVGMAQITWEAWKYVFLFCMFGCTIRLFNNLSNGRVRKGREKYFDILSIYVTGCGAGFVVFVLIEGFNSWKQARIIPDLVVCGLILLAAMNYRFVFDAALSFAKAWRDNFIKSHGGTPPSDKGRPS